MSNVPKDKHILDIHPKEWEIDHKRTYVMQYRNLDHFKFHCKEIRSDEVGVNYSEALDDLLNNRSMINDEEYETIKNLVKNNLLKRGLISDTIYESYKYEVEGQIVDVAKVIAEDPMCCLVPNETYKSYFYEMYIRVNLPYRIGDHEIKRSVAKILATVQLLEREHIYIKINLVAYGKNITYIDGYKKDMLNIIPVFSHKDVKDINRMSAVINNRTSRKFIFAVKEEYYGEDIDEGYGKSTDLPNCINIYDIDEVELASNIIKQTIKEGTR